MSEGGSAGEESVGSFDQNERNIIHVRAEVHNNTNLTMRNSREDEINRIDGESVRSSSVASKRSMSREEYEESCSDDGFTTVGKKAKKPRYRSSRNSGLSKTDRPLQDFDMFCDEYIEVAITHKEELPKQIQFCRILRDENITDIEKIKYKSPYKIFIRFKNNIAAERCLDCDNFRQKGWICRKTNEKGFSFGLLRDIDLEYQEEEIKGVLDSDIEIINIKRLDKKNKKEQKWNKCETIRICFKGPILPPFIRIYGTKVKVEPYIFPVTQCSICWKYGHIKKYCPTQEQICPKCGEKHTNCETNDFMCVNCGGKHMSIFFILAMFPVASESEPGVRFPTKSPPLRTVFGIPNGESIGSHIILYDAKPAFLGPSPSTGTRRRRHGKTFVPHITGRFT